MANSWPTTAEMLVMTLLQDHPKGQYGLQIVEASGGKVKRGSVYVLLGRLEERGFVKVMRPKGEQTHPGMARPIYKLTGEGAKVLGAAESIGLVVARA